MFHANATVRYISRAALACLLLLTSACSPSQEENTDTLSFTVDPKLLGPQFADPVHGFSLRPPANWTPVSDSVMNQVQAGLAAAGQSDDRFAPEMLQVFRHDPHGAHVALGRFRDELSSNDRKTVVLAQADGLRMRFGRDEVMADRFSYKGCELDQLLVTGGEHVMIKLFVHRADIAMYVVDYVVPTAHYETHLRAIESSIGSMSFDS